MKTTRFVWGAVATWTVTACATGASLRREADAIREQLDDARGAGAYRCAPVALARSEAELEFLITELDQGHALRAAEHRDRAGTALTQVVAGVQACAQDPDGDGVLRDDDLCPDVKGPVSQSGCPDPDGDGIVGPADKCPDVAEDLDGKDDEDGCPESDDTDGDGILDENDACPVQPETVNGYDDEDGCPDRKLELVEVKRDLKKIEIKERVFFRTARASIRTRSYDLLNQVAEAIMTNPTMAVVVEGHTDSVGSAASNLKLSQRRADAVRSYLIRQGVPEDRLTAIGYGEERPLDSNRTREGRSRNRRVEFTIAE